MMSRELALAFALLACNGSPRETQTITEAASAASLTGAWDAKLSLTRPYPLGLSAPASRLICGTIGFVENRRADLSHEIPSVGVYDLDLSLLGLNWLGDESFPNAVATTPNGTVARADLSQPDSVTIVLNPGSTERIVLQGRRDVAGIDGDWVAQSARGTATGSFSLRPHIEARPNC